MGTQTQIIDALMLNIGTQTLISGTQIFEKEFEKEFENSLTIVLKLFSKKVFERKF